MQPPSRSSLSFGMEDHQTRVGDETDDHDTVDANATPLRAQILRMVRESPPPPLPPNNEDMSDHFEIRPATLSRKLGISINDASSELCGLLRAVGKGSSFFFEKVGTTGTVVQSMVFVFPPDFERRALGSQRRDDLLLSMRHCWNVAVKALKLVTAFGLILSTLIVAIAALAALVAALVAMSRGGGDARTRNTLTRQMRQLFLTVRQLLWCYAVFGTPGSEDQDPFFREAAYDTWLVLSVCCGNPGSIFFWMRAGHLRRRRHRIARGWGSSAANNVIDSGDTTTSDLDGISLIRRNAHGQEERIPAPTALEDNINVMESRGLLPSLVEFLFGPNQPMRPSEADKWRLRSAVIVEKSSRTGRIGNSAVSLAELAPYADSPPESLNDEFKVLTEGLVVVTYFNGVPSSQTQTADEDHSDTTRKSKNAALLFDFPELIAESHMGIRYDDLVDGSHESETDSWKNFFFITGETKTQTTTLSSRTETPSFLFERRKVFSLSKQKFVHCLLVASLNLLGVLWFAQSLAPGGILQQSLGGFGQTLRSTLIPILWFYGRLFFAIPTVRLVYVLAWNRSCRSRNGRRKKLAGELRHSQTTLDVAGHEKETSV